MVEVLEARADQADFIGSRLTAGQVVVVRQVDELKAFIRAYRECLAKYESDDTIRQFYDHGTDSQSFDFYKSVAEVVKLARTMRMLDRFMAPFVRRLGFSGPILTDGGTPRVRLTPKQHQALKASTLFPSADFQRKVANDITEVFMGQTSNIHRDYNRPHDLTQYNMWFGMHAMDERQVLTIWPQHYTSRYSNMPNTMVNRLKLGRPARYSLELGDMIIFHGEHLHCSPLNQSNTFYSSRYVRHSYDYRIATNCLDDNSHYRANCFELNAFLDAKAYQLYCDVIAEDVAGILSGLEYVVSLSELPNTLIVLALAKCDELAVERSVLIDIVAAYVTKLRGVFWLWRILAMFGDEEVYRVASKRWRLDREILTASPHENILDCYQGPRNQYSPMQLGSRVDDLLKKNESVLSLRECDLQPNAYDEIGA